MNIFPAVLNIFSVKLKIELDLQFITDTYDSTGDKPNINQTKTFILSGDKSSIYSISNLLLFLIYEGFSEIEITDLFKVEIKNLKKFRIKLDNDNIEEGMVVEEEDGVFTWLIDVYSLQQIVIDHILPLSYQNSHYHICNGQEYEIFIESE